MAAESEERKMMKEALTYKGAKVTFPEDMYLRITRIKQDMNRVERENGNIKKGECMYSIQKDGAPKGKFFVVRN